MSNLDCPRKTCNGEFKPSGAAHLLFECVECGESLSQSGIKDLAKEDGALASLANELLERAGHSREDELDRRHIYLAESDDGMVKIGKSKNPNQRLRQLSTGSPTDLSLLSSALVEKAGRQERRLHEKFQQYNERGEWFDLPEQERQDLIREVESLQ